MLEFGFYSVAKFGLVALEIITKTEVFRTVIDHRRRKQNSGHGNKKHRKRLLRKKYRPCQQQRRRGQQRQAAKHRKYKVDQPNRPVKPPKKLGDIISSKFPRIGYVRTNGGNYCDGP